MWFGWFRPTARTPWIKLAEGPTYHDCWAALLDATSAVRGGDLLVCRHDPNKGGVGNLTPRSIERKPAENWRAKVPLRRRFGRRRQPWSGTAGYGPTGGSASARHRPSARPPASWGASADGGASRPGCKCGRAAERRDPCRLECASPLLPRPDGSRRLPPRPRVECGHDIDFDHEVARSRFGGHGRPCPSKLVPVGTVAGGW
jgi:hypothetical protein